LAYKLKTVIKTIVRLQKEGIISLFFCFYFNIFLSLCYKTEKNILLIKLIDISLPTFQNSTEQYTKLKTLFLKYKIKKLVMEILLKKT